MFRKEKPNVTQDDLRTLATTLRKEITEEAKKEIEHCRSVYDFERNTVKVLGIILGGFFGIILTIVAFFGGRSWGEYKKSLKAESDRNFTNIIADLRTNLEVKIDDQFLTTNISSLVSNAAQKRIDLIAHPIIKGRIENEIQPTLLNFDRTIVAFATALSNASNTELELKTTLRNAEAALGNLTKDADFANKAILAHNDNRTAFNDLVNLSSDAKSKYSREATSVVLAVIASYVQNVFPIVEPELPDDYKDRDSWTLSNIRGAWNTVDQTAAPAFVNFVMHQKVITEEERRCFLRNVYAEDSHNSLRAADFAAHYVDTALGGNLYGRPFDFRKLEPAFQSFFRTNHLFTVRTNKGLYELVHSSDTNKLTYVKLSESLQMVIIRLDHVPIEGSLVGKIMHLSPPRLDTITTDAGFHYKNVWGMKYTGYPPFNNFKLEFNYEIDATKTNLPSISVKDNVLEMDDTSFQLK